MRLGTKVSLWGWDAITKARVSLSKPGPAVHTQLIVWVVAVNSATCGAESWVSIYKSTVCRGIPFSTLVLKSHIAWLCITLTTLVTVTVCSICIWSSSGLTGMSSSPENWEISLQQSAQSPVFTWPGGSPVTWWPKSSLLCRIRSIFWALHASVTPRTPIRL